MKERSAGMVLFREKKFLLLKYQHQQVFWGFPKGIIESNETQKQAALREVKEETGLVDIEVNNDFLEETTYVFKREAVLTDKKVTWFLGEVYSGKVKISDEHTDWQWVTYGQALEILHFENDKNLLRNVKKYLLKISDVDI